MRSERFQNVVWAKRVLDADDNDEIYGDYDRKKVKLVEGFVGFC